MKISVSVFFANEEGFILSLFLLKKERTITVFAVSTFREGRTFNFVDICYFKNKRTLAKFSTVLVFVNDRFFSLKGANVN